MSGCAHAASVTLLVPRTAADRSATPPAQYLLKLLDPFEYNVDSKPDHRDRDNLLQLM